MLELHLSRDERKRKSFDAKNLKLALQALREDGFVILHDVIAAKHIESLRERMLSDVADILALDDVPLQFNDGHLQQDPPRANPIRSAIQLPIAVLSGSCSAINGPPPRA